MSSVAQSGLTAWAALGKAIPMSDEHFPGGWEKGLGKKPVSLFQLFVSQGASNYILSLWCEAVSHWLNLHISERGRSLPPIFTSRVFHKRSNSVT